MSQHEFRKGLQNLGIELTDSEFSELMATVDEDNSNEIDYNEFANSGIMGGKFFAARSTAGFSGCKTKKEMSLKRRKVRFAFSTRYLKAFTSAGLPRSTANLRTKRWTRSGARSNSLQASSSAKWCGMVAPVACELAGWNKTQILHD